MYHPSSSVFISNKAKGTHSIYAQYARVYHLVQLYCYTVLALPKLMHGSLQGLRRLPIAKHGGCVGSSYDPAYSDHLHVT